MLPLRMRKVTGLISYPFMPKTKRLKVSVQHLKDGAELDYQELARCVKARH